MSAPIEFWFDFSSPYSYLASERIDELAAKHGRKVKWRPIMLGAAFKASGLPFLISQSSGLAGIRSFSHAEAARRNQ